MRVYHLLVIADMKLQWLVGSAKKQTTANAVIQSYRKPHKSHLAKKDSAVIQVVLSSESCLFNKQMRQNLDSQGAD